jgi:hypothetical protein
MLRSLVSIPASPTNTAAGHWLLLMAYERTHLAPRPRGGRGACLFRLDGRHKSQVRRSGQSRQSLAEFRVGVREQMAVAVKSERHAGVPGAPRNLQCVTPGLNPKGDGSVAQVVGTKGTQIDLLNRWMPEAPSPGRGSQRAASGRTEDRLVAYPMVQVVGTDIKGQDLGVSVQWTTSDVAALSYPLYAPSDAHCCPSGGARLVRFEWNGTAVVPLDSLPP